MSNREPLEFSRPQTKEGKEVSHRCAIAERQRTAQRLLLAAAEQTYDGELDIDWDSDLDADLAWLPSRLSSLYDTEIWLELTPAQRRDLGRHELVNLLSFGIYAEAALTMLMFRSVGENRVLVDDFTRLALRSIEEETRNSAMFTRLINKAGLPVYRRPRGVWLLSKLVLFTPSGVVGRGVVLMVQEAVHSWAAAMAADPGLQRHVRQLMRIHEISGTRHIEFSRAELAQVVADSGRLKLLVAGYALAALAAALYPMLLNDKVYPNVGIDAKRARAASREGDQYALRAQAMTDSFVRFGIEIGLFGHRGERLLLTRGQVWPQGVPNDCRTAESAAKR